MQDAHEDNARIYDLEEVLLDAIADYLVVLVSSPGKLDFDRFRA
jgi:hypothetical protein